MRASRVLSGYRFNTTVHYPTVAVPSCCLSYLHLAYTSDGRYESSDTPRARSRRTCHTAAIVRYPDTRSTRGAHRKRRKSGSLTCDYAKHFALLSNRNWRSACGTCGKKGTSARWKSETDRMRNSVIILGTLRTRVAMDHVVAGDVERQEDIPDRT